MCGRYTLRLQAEEIADQLELPLPEEFNWSPSFNIAPTQMVPVVIQSPEKTLLIMRWGLIPHWMKAKPDGTADGFINARSETAAEKPAFRTAFQQKRCLIPADGFYEWKKMPDGRKQPMYFFQKDRQLFTFAGLWSAWQTPDGETLHTCAILTTEPNDLVTQVHNRMPVILPAESRDDWLSDLPKESLQALLSPYPAQDMAAHAVSTRVNSPRFNDEQCVESLANDSPAGRLLQ
jgi:putative SOS response-associated peptidase YedK